MVKAEELFNQAMISDISPTEIVTKLYHLADKVIYFKYDAYYKGIYQMFEERTP